MFTFPLNMNSFQCHIKPSYVIQNPAILLVNQKINKSEGLLLAKLCLFFLMFTKNVFVKCSVLSQSQLQSLSPWEQSATLWHLQPGRSILGMARTFQKVHLKSYFWRTCVHLVVWGAATDTVELQCQRVLWYSFYLSWGSPVIWNEPSYLSRDREEGGHEGFYTVQRTMVYCTFPLNLASSFVSFHWLLVFHKADNTCLLFCIVVRHGQTLSPAAWIAGLAKLPLYFLHHLNISGLTLKALHLW